MSSRGRPANPRSLAKPRPGAGAMPARSRAGFSLRSPRRPSIRGFSLLELLVAVSVSGIMLAVGIPGFRGLMASNRLSTTANAYVASFNEARLAAIRRNSVTQFCSNVAASNGTDTLGTACSTLAGAAFVLDASGNTATQIYDAPTLPAGLTLASGVAALRYTSQGFARAAVGGTGPYTGLLLDLSSSGITSNNRRCLYLTTGSIVSSCVVTSSGACPSSEPSSCRQ